MNVVHHSSVVDVLVYLIATYTARIIGTIAKVIGNNLLTIQCNGQCVITNLMCYMYIVRIYS